MQTPIAHNDNEITDIHEEMMEVLFNWRRLLDFLKSDTLRTIGFSEREVDFLGDMFWKFTEFDDEKKYNSLECKGLLVSILSKISKKTQNLRKAFNETGVTASFSENEVKDAFEELLQSDVAYYSWTDKNALLGDTSNLVHDIFIERAL